MADKSTFDVGEYFKSEGIQLLGEGEKPGVVRVKMPDGSEGEFNAKEAAAALGDANAEIIFNRPNEALQVSPASMMDRVALSTDNVKGQLSYLKKKYGEVELDNNGDLVVKHNGVWKAIDPRGLGNGDGWDMAKELAGDAADLAKMAVGTAGNIIGGALGTVGAPGLGTVAGSAVGGTLANAAFNNVLGRIAGTYDASPEEMAKEATLDLLVNAAGEGIALGAKNAVLPAIKNTFAKVASAAPAVKQGVKEYLVNGTQMPERAVNFILDNADDAFKGHAVLKEAAKKAAAASKAGGNELTSVLDLGAKQIQKVLAPAIDTVQAEASAMYRKGMADAARAAVTDSPDVAVQAWKPIQKGIKELSDIGVFMPGVQSKMQGMIPANIERLKDLFQIDEASAKQIAKRLANFDSTARTLMTGTDKGAAAVGKALQKSKTMREALYEVVEYLPENSRFVSQIKSVANNIGAGIVNQIPGKARQIAAATNSQYQKQLGLLARTSKIKEELTVKGGVSQQLESWIKAVSNRPGETMSEKELFNQLLDISGRKFPGLSKQVDSLLAGMEIDRLLPKNIGDSILSQVSAPVRSPRGVAKAVQLAQATKKVVDPKLQRLIAASNQVRTLPGVKQGALLADPEKFMAVMSQVLTSTQDEFYNGQQ